MKQERGKLYVFEGPDKVGKTTLAHLLVDHLEDKGEKVLYYHFPGKKAGTLGKVVRTIHNTPLNLDISEPIHPTSLQLLHIAAHIDAIHNYIIPPLRQGVTVVLDRFWWSTMIYGERNGVDLIALDKMIGIEKDNWGNYEPACLFLFEREGSDEELTRLYSSWFRRSEDSWVRRSGGKFPTFKINNNMNVSTTLSYLVATISSLAEQKEMVF